MPSITIPITICDTNATATIDYHVTYKGAPQTRDSPAEAMEYNSEVTRLHIWDKMTKTPAPVEPIPPWLETLILSTYEDDIYNEIESAEGYAKLYGSS